MGKILDLSNYKKNKSIVKGALDRTQLNKIIEMLDLKRKIAEELFYMTEEFLKEVGYNPADFAPDEDYTRDFVSADMVEFMEGGEAALDLSYFADIDGVRYRTWANAQSMFNDKTEMEVMLLKLDNDNGEWLVLAGDKWDRGPGQDFFGKGKR